MKMIRTALAALACLSLAQAANAAEPRVALDTSAGKIVVELAPAKAPTTVANFLAYVKKGQYDGTVFHRVIPGFMIQGGGFTPDMKEKPTAKPIPLEARNGLSNARGTIAMARTGNPNSATAQFFINVADNPRLDADQAADGHGYAVFGKVVEGMDTVDKIRAVPTSRRGMFSDVPVEPVVIKSAKLID
ncbi:MAG: peptidylprolyl isomerase [Burkholderiaceae bacterium]